MLAKQLAMAFKYLVSTSAGQIQNKQNMTFANTLHYTDWLVSSKIALWDSDSGFINDSH